MPHAKAVLIGLSSSLSEAVRELAAQRGIETISVATSESLASLRGTAGVCLVAARSDDEALQTVRSVGKVLSGVPIAVLDQGLTSRGIVRLVRHGVVDVLDADSLAEDLFAQVYAHFSPEGETRGAHFVLGESGAARNLREQIERVAGTSSTVLLTGETGTGKGLVAREIHRLSRSSEGPFVHADSTVFAPSVFESELFGHERGAFTSANARRQGRFELAEGGTIFLDEIGELELTLQVKLLRVLQDRVYERVGGAQPLPMNARVVAATNCDLTDAVRKGRFRADLYYRLNVFHIETPPLRERTEDIPMLVAAQLEDLGRRLGIAAPRAGASFLEALESHRWPGNVRELMNILERCLIERRVDTLEAQDLEGILEVESQPQLQVPARPSRRRDEGRDGSARLVGPSEAMRLVRARIDQTAQSSSSVLVTGETGTGKELVARAIHEASGRHPLVVVGVLELSEELLELELFGQEAGALGAGSSARAGLFERAHGGTLFLDEIGEAPLELQAKILRALETGEVRRLGAQSSQPVDTRVIAATHRDLEQAVRVGSFREDLYYRIRECSIDVAPLRERPEDVEAISYVLMAELSDEAQRPRPQLSQELYELLRSQAYPGNVRELRTQLRNLLIAWDGTSPLTPSDLVEHLAATTPRLSAEDVAERQRMVEAYRDCHGNQEAARRRLGLSRGEWRHRWSRLGLDVFRKR